jgi:hypothetical protein
MRRSLPVLVALALLFVSAPPAQAAVTVSRAELRSGQLRVEGTGALTGSTVTASSPESSAGARADGSGAFRIEASNFRASTCQVTVTDGTTSTTTTLSGCTPTGTNPPPPTGSCTIVPTTFPDGNVGTLSTWFFSTTGCRTSESPVRFSVVSGAIPPGTRLFTQGVSSGGITGTPTTEGLFTFTIRVRDFTGASDSETFSIRINPPRPLVITNQSDALSPGTVGEFYCCGNLFADGGVPGYTWSLRSGQLPPGLSLSASPGRITGTPTVAGAFSFLVRVTDSRGAFAERTFSITVS